ncbi:MAG: hypothetical protein H6737_20515 [Alphaproteobacteria bacterium]|nr:hypothetical protein [Alphaproteobacteria bacterium]
MYNELVDTNLSSRELIRNLRSTMKVDGCLPESVAWQTFVELRRRGEPDANELFIGTLRNLHSRRCIAGMDLPCADHLTDEHRLVEDVFLADLWKAYKKCIKNNRTGPAQQLLRDIEERINEAN